MTSPSAQWQHWILIVASLWLLLETWRGWKLGLIRGILRFMTLIAAWLAAEAAAVATSAGFAIFFHKTPSILPAVVATIVGLAIYSFAAFISGLLFKRTTDHHGIFRFILGIGGALCGFLFGLLILWGGISLVRSLGVLGEMRLMEARQKGLPPSSDAMACNLVRLARSLELGSTGQLFVQLDPLSTTFYDNARKFMKVANDRDALMRFITAPSTQRLLQNRHVMALLNDAQVQEGLAAHNIFSLLENKNVKAALHDPELLKEIKSFHLTETLKYALEKPDPSLPRAQEEPAQQELPPSQDQ